jgi:hypothetical protein
VGPSLKSRTCFSHQNKKNGKSKILVFKKKSKILQISLSKYRWIQMIFVDCWLTSTSFSSISLLVKIYVKVAKKLDASGLSNKTKKESRSLEVPNIKGG